MNTRTISRVFCLAVGVMCWTAGMHASACLPGVPPETVGMSPRRLARIDEIVAEGLKDRRMPGCVVLVGRRGKVVLLKAYGDRQVSSGKVPMTTDAVFDLASLTKPVATSSAIMLLADRGKVRLEDPIAKTIPEFAANGKERITVSDLLTHQGGLIADNSLSDYADGPIRAWERLLAIRPLAPRGERFIYSDVGFMILGEMVRRVSGKDLAQFSRDHVFQPLGMTETCFLPEEHLRNRAAPTERRNGRWMQGEVHDPRAHQLGGIAGHAGLFSTAADLAVFAQMILNGGEYGGARILGRESVAEWTKPRPVPGGFRALGWDTRSSLSSNRSPAYSARAFGHGGFTGTSLWMDPQRELIVLFLSNRLHPDGKGSVNSLAARIGTAAVEALEPTLEAQVLTGIDVLEREGYAPLAGRRVGLITNHTGVDRHGVRTACLLRKAPGVQLLALFSPEHGFEGRLDAEVADARDPASGLPIHSLYGKTRQPTAESLRGIDTLVFDVQDIGTRFYTYISTMGHAMQAAAAHKLRFVVLDRPNPINGRDVAGPMLDAGRESFVGFHRLPVRHGMTVGELAGMFKGELHLDLDLQVVRLKGWRRDMYLDSTGLKWINPSPNMRNLTEAVLYPGIGLLETTNLSVGRGTETPFEVFGAPWLDASRLARALSESGLAGARFAPTAFTPDASKFRGQRCQGIRITVTDRNALEPTRVGLEIARQLRRLHPDVWDAGKFLGLLGNQRVHEALLGGKSVAEMESLYRADLQVFLRKRASYLLYDP